MGPQRQFSGAWDGDFIEHALGGKNEKLVQAWMDESHQLAETVAYRKIAEFNCDAGLKRIRIFLDQSYADEATTVVEEQLAKAGYRLAYFLNLTFP